MCDGMAMSMHNQAMQIHNQTMMDFQNQINLQNHLDFVNQSMINHQHAIEGMNSKPGIGLVMLADSIKSKFASKCNPKTDVIALQKKN